MTETKIKITTIKITTEIVFQLVQCVVSRNLHKDEI